MAQCGWRNGERDGARVKTLRGWLSWPPRRHRAGVPSGPARLLPSDAALDLELNEALPRQVIDSLGQLSVDDRLLYYWAARRFFSGCGTVVDGGALVGASTTALAEGLLANPATTTTSARLHVYDLFEDAEDGYSARLIRGWYGEEAQPGPYDFQRHFDRNTASYRALLQVHRGDVTQIGYADTRDIEILSVDLAKTPALMHVVATEFFPRLLPGRSLVLHQDYLYAFQPWLLVAMELLADFLERVYDVPTQSTSVFVPRVRMTSDDVRRRLGADPAGYYTMDHLPLLYRAMERSKRPRARCHLLSAIAYFLHVHGEVLAARRVAMRLIEELGVSRNLVVSTDLRVLLVDHLGLDLDVIFPPGG